MTKPRRPSLKELTANASANASAGACGVPSFDGVAFAEGAAGYKQALREAVPPVKLAQLMAHWRIRRRVGISGYQGADGTDQGPVTATSGHHVQRHVPDCELYNSHH